MTTQTTKRERPGKTFIGAMMPSPLAEELKTFAWMNRTTVSEVLRQTTAQLLAAQKESAQ